jgi:hypothetical protein
MKSLLLACGVALSLMGCGDKADDPTVAPDPFLGRWKAETLRSVSYDASGKVLTDKTTTAPSQLDVSPTIISFSATDNSPYTRNGETLTVTPKNGTAGETYYARNLTKDSFTFEFNGPRTTGKGYYVQSIPYHR